MQQGRFSTVLSGKCSAGRDAAAARLTAPPWPYVEYRASRSPRHCRVWKSSDVPISGSLIVPRYWLLIRRYDLRVMRLSLTGYADAS
jgi:hypothetical protein